MHNVWPHFKSKSPYTFVLQGFTSKSVWKVRLKKEFEFLGGLPGLSGTCYIDLYFVTMEPIL